MVSISERELGRTSDEINGDWTMIEYTIKSEGLIAKIVNYGGILNALEVKDKNGDWIDVVTGWDTMDDIIKNRRFTGRLVGRYANRIANGQFELDGETYNLYKEC